MQMTSWFGELRTQAVHAAARNEPRGLQAGIGRSLLALAQLSALVFSQDAVLFSPVLSPPDGLICDGIRASSLWCVTQVTGHGMLISRIVTIVVLLVVLSGYRPKFTCIPHWYVAFSMVAPISESDGGERALMLVTMLLIPLYLGDEREWHWTRPRAPMPPVWRGAASAVQVVLRLQLSVIYLGAVVSKSMDPLWRQGSAMLVIAKHSTAGFPNAVRDFLDPVLRTYWMVAAASWSVIAVQLVLAVLIWGGARARRWALVLGIGLHAGIMFLMNLAAFGLVMIGVLVIVCAPPGCVGKIVGNRDERADQTPDVRAESGDSDGSGAALRVVDGGAAAGPSGPGVAQL